MKKFKATYWRGNPQLGGYEMTSIIEASTIRSAEKKANERTKKTLYGRMRLLKVEEV